MHDKAINFYLLFPPQCKFRVLNSSAFNQKALVSPNFLYTTLKLFVFIFYVNYALHDVVDDYGIIFIQCLCSN